MTYNLRALAEEALFFVVAAGVSVIAAVFLMSLALATLPHDTRAHEVSGVSAPVYIQGKGLVNAENSAR